MSHHNTSGENYGRDWAPYSSSSSGATYIPDNSDARASAARRTFHLADGRTIEDAGIRAGEIIGHRAWMVTREGRLRSMFAEHEWTPSGIEIGEVIRTTYQGVHAFKSARRAAGQYECYSVKAPIAFGTVALWGNVIEHEDGYRAQFGAVHSIVRIHQTFSPYKFRKRWWHLWRDPILSQLRASYCQAEGSA